MSDSKYNGVSFALDAETLRLIKELEQTENDPTVRREKIQEILKAARRAAGKEEPPSRQH
jgi:hypothetical protein